jgi:3-hydroxyacyl-CoA dehydrogenase
VLDALLASIERAERECAALVIWQTREPFSLGANLAAIQPAIEAAQWDRIEASVAKFQETSQRLMYSLIPTVAAVRGLALGGGCELAMHCDRVVAALESYIGLVEAGVGLLPAGGGSKELVKRAAQDAARGATGSQQDPLPFLRTRFPNHRQGDDGTQCARSARARIPACVGRRDLQRLRVAARCEGASEGVGRIGVPAAGAARAIPVVGRTGIATLQMLLVNMRDGGFISPHDFEIGHRIARVFCGGEVDAGSLVDEKWLLDLERAEFMALLRNSKTQERIAHTLKTGKPLRN